MKRLFLLFIILPVLLCGADRAITLQNLPGTEWEWHSQRADSWPDFTFVFMPDGSLQLKNSSYGFDEGGGKFEGSYSVINNELSLTWKLYSFYDKGDPEMHRASAKLVNDSNSVYHDTTITFGSITLVCLNSTVNSGQNRVLDGINVVTSGCKKAIVTKNAKIRSKPDVKSDIIRFGADLGEEGLAYCPAGKELRVLARTKDKVTVEKWNNYWYYVELVSAGEFGARYGWVYGEFLKLQ